MLKATAEDLEAAEKLFNEISEKADELCGDVDNICEKAGDGSLSTAKGLSFLEMKYQTMLSYVMDITSIINKKIQGKPIRNEQSVDRLIENRTILEKIKPIDKKLKYQIDKLIKTANSATSDPNDPTNLKPNLDNYESSDDQESSDEGGVEKTAKGVYKPPKLAPVRYDEEDTVRAIKEKKLEEKKRRALTSGLYRELREELHDGPEEIHESIDLHRAKTDKKLKEKKDYEEKYFIRMPVSKKEKNEARRMRTLNDINSIAEFGQVAGLTNADLDEDDDKVTPSKKRKAKKQGKGKRKGKKKRKIRI
ncbi:DgyrCDS12207 [Dimorphilus gyrociliatus]|uniref:DgyrCDS12207 n=1 Tax=Dimorphilus gyrociliatus TaxID=2664684 RepID=A0A7I8W7W9_9ANNE|nr:DgyrCDS12207 [Dimorphilus gyrociliatus]